MRHEGREEEGAEVPLALRQAIISVYLSEDSSPRRANL
jgi:hypothetical protein